MYRTWQLFDGPTWANENSRIFQNSDIVENALFLSALLAMNNTLRAYCLTSGTCSLNSVEIQCVIPEKFAFKWRRVRPAGNGVIPREVQKKTTTNSLSSVRDLVCTCKIWWHCNSPFLEILSYK